MRGRCGVQVVRSRLRGQAYEHFDAVELSTLTQRLSSAAALWMS